MGWGPENTFEDAILDVFHYFLTFYRLNNYSINQQINPQWKKKTISCSPDLFYIFLILIPSIGVLRLCIALPLWTGLRRRWRCRSSPPSSWRCPGPWAASSAPECSLWPESSAKGWQEVWMHNVRSASSEEGQNMCGCTCRVNPNIQSLVFLLVFPFIHF